MEKAETILTLAILAVVAYLGYKLYQAFGSGGTYCNDNQSSWLCQLFAGPPGTGGEGSSCIGLGCTSNLFCSYFPSLCSSNTGSASMSITD